MSRDAARAIGRDPAGDFALVHRDSTGTVQTTQEVNNTGVDPGTTGSGTVTVATATLTSPRLALYTSATATIAGGGTGTSMTILRNGSAIASTATGAGSTSTSGTHTTPLNAPTYAVRVNASGSTPTAVTLAVSREQRVA